MLFDITQKVCNKGDKITLVFNGISFPVECVSTTVIGFERQYEVRFADGSSRFVTAATILKQAN